MFLPVKRIIQYYIGGLSFNGYNIFSSGKHTIGYKLET